MRTSRSLAIIACVFYFKSESVSALPDQSCETFFCGPDIEGTLAGWLEWMTEGSPWDDKPDQKSPTTPQLPQSPKDDGANKPYLDNVPSTQEDPIEIFVTAEEDCKANPNSPNAQSDAASQNLQYCNVATARLIWPARCDDTTQNTKTASIIGGMDNNFKTSKDPLCPQPGGVAFWLANITPSQSKALMQDAAAVRAVTANRPYKNDDLRRVYSRANKRQVPAADFSKRRLRKRDRLTVVKQSPADPSLTFLSTARRPQGTSKPRYTYSFFSYAGKGVRIYLIDSGLDHFNFEFDHLDDVNVEPYPRLEWIFAEDVPAQKVDMDQDSHGTCLSSKIAGKYCGVAKEASLVMAKTSLSLGSFLDVLGKVVQHIQTRMDTWGWIVVNISAGWTFVDPSSDLNAIKMRDYIAALTNVYQVVVVVSAGPDLQNNFGNINTYPALLSLDHNIITVGAVRSTHTNDQGASYGQRYPWSRGGNALTVSAPGFGTCSTTNDVTLNDWEGASFAGAVVSGLVATFLSIPALHNYFATQASIPAAVRDYVEKMQRRRFQAQLAVWNGLEGDDVNPDFGTGDADDGSSPLWQWIPPLGSSNPVTDPAPPQSPNRRL